MSHCRAALLIALAQAACSSASGGGSNEAQSTESGSSGASATTGASGTSGASTTGTSGSSGASAGGSSGASGAASGTGATGASASGSSGASATGGSGASGMTGAATGTTGSNAGSSGDAAGASGASGDASGASGASGTAGSTGASGSGVTGTTGTSGTSAGSTSGTCVVGCGASDAGAGASDAGDGGASLPVLHTFAANQSGRTGADLVLSISAADANKSAFGLDIQLGDKNGQPVNAFQGGSGQANTYERTVLFDNSSAVGQSSFTRTVTLAGFMTAYPSLARVSVAVVDTVGSSARSTASVALQSVETMRQSCDVNVVTSRCSPGLACAGSPATCQSAAAPQITKFEYVTSSGAQQGARMLFEGTDPADDIDNIHLEFLDSHGNPVMIDLTGNMDYASTFDLSIANASQLGQFFYADQTTLGFDGTVTQLAATPSGSASGSGARVTAMLEAPPVATTGAACDTRGFTTCAESVSCLKDPTSGASTCVATSSAITTASNNAPTLDPAAGASFVTGYATGTNLWGDPPSDCVPPGVTGFPEGIVKLHLDDFTSSLMLTTNNQETDAQFAVFVLSGTGASVGTSSLGCNEGYPASVTLSNLDAGDYTVVVSATTSAGGQFGITAQ
jgi:hypothetical protein